jgi:PelA/Pel-15E family pectate lyase
MKCGRWFLILPLAIAVQSAAAVSWREILRQPAPWYAGAEAATVAANVLLYQTASGGWPKNHDMTLPPGPHEFEHEDVTAPTIDNDATYTQIRFLAAVDAAQTDPRYRAAVEKGLRYLLAAQYANGGWPQFYPLLPGYYTHITFNDDAMTGVLELLRDVAEGRQPFDWVGPEIRGRAATAVAKGIACILRCQIEVHGVKTAWCAQHDEKTFEPVPARAYEHESISGYESVGVVRFLMGIDHPSPAVIASIRGAVAWFEQVRLTGLRIERIPAPDLPHGFDKRVVADPAAPPQWARFYEIGTNRPIFGGRDAVIRYSLAEIEGERRAGYRWYVEAPAKLLADDYPKWAAKWLKATSP